LDWNRSAQNSTFRPNGDLLWAKWIQYDAIWLMNETRLNGSQTTTNSRSEVFQFMRTHLPWQWDYEFPHLEGTNSKQNIYYSRVCDVCTTAKVDGNNIATVLGEQSEKTFCR